MKIKLRHIITLIVLFFVMSYASYGQAGACSDPDYEPCGPNHQCVPRSQCGGPNPPPPGLVVPIDSNISFLLIAGLGLGIYFLAFRKAASTEKF